jgi:hypothetical protein
MKRFYVTEYLAPQAQIALWKPVNREKTAYALVRLRNGHGVVEQVDIGDKTIAEVAREP